MKAGIHLSMALSVALAAPAGADVLCLQDGRILEGPKMTRRAEGGVVVHFENGDVEVPGDLVLECILENAEPYVPRNDDERKKVEKGFVRYGDEWMTPSRRDRLVEDRLEEQRERLEEIKETRYWRNRIQDETRNFAFEVTVPPHIFESYRELMETYFEAFSDKWDIRRPRDLGKLPVKFYVDYDAFLQVTAVPRGVQGFFRFVEPLELNLYYDRLDPRATEEVMYHEAGHYLQKLINVDFKYPHWPGEALCEYYAASTWDPEEEELTTGLVHESRLAEVKLDISRDEWVDLKGMITGCQDRNYHDYTWGWSFVHFLMSNRRYANRFEDFFLALAEARDIERQRSQYTIKTSLETVTGDAMLEAFMEYMRIDDEEELQELEDEWYTHLQELEITSTDGLVGAAKRNLRLRPPRLHKARRLFEDAMESGELDAVAYFKYGEVLDQLEEEKEAREAWSKAVRLDPLEADYYVKLGESLLDADDEELQEEGRRHLRLALEIEPDNLYLEKNARRLLDD